MFGLFRSKKTKAATNAASSVMPGSKWMLPCRDGNPFEQEYPTYVLDVQNGWVKYSYNPKSTITWSMPVDTFVRVYIPKESPAMIIDCLACHKPIPVPNGIRDTNIYEIMACCGTDGSKYLITVEQIQGPCLEDVELDARRNKTS